MENSVIIVIVCAILCAWFAWLIYQYAVLSINIRQNETIKFYTNRYYNLQKCMNDVIESIHNKFPDSTIQYSHNIEGDEIIEGEIIY